MLLKGGKEERESREKRGLELPQKKKVDWHTGEGVAGPGKRQSPEKRGNRFGGGERGQE